jgi:hypothetical protein
MPKNREDPVTYSDGYARHPAFGMARVSRVSSSPGETLFQSDLQHGEYIEVTLSRAERRRELKQDWVHPKNMVARFDLSMAQWASLVSSVGTEGVPVTISYINGETVPGLNPDPRLKQTADEVAAAAADAYRGIQDALAAYKKTLDEKAPAAERKAKLSTLIAVTRNAAPNVNFATDSLTRHAEAVVEKSRADIEAMVRMAQERGERVIGTGEHQAALDSAE